MAQLGAPDIPPGKEAGATLADAGTDIEYLYLDFDTELPGPCLDATATAPPPPACPNLKKYTSPFRWSGTRKLLITWLACGVTLLAAFAAGEYTPPAAQLLSVWHVSQVAFNVGVTSFTSGFAIAPMVLAPFSEINGRRPVFIASGILFTGMLPCNPEVYTCSREVYKDADCVL